MGRIPPRSDPSDPSPRPFAFKLILPGLLVTAAVACLIGFWQWKGSTGLAGSGLGVAIGALITTVNHLLRRKAREATGHKLASAVMASILASFGLFLTASLVVGLLWKAAALPAILTALAIYLTYSYYEAFTGRAPGRAGPRERG